MILLLIFSILLAITAAIFALENTAAVTVSFLSYKFDGSLAVVLMAVFALGILAATAALLPALLTAKWKVRSLRRRVRDLEGAVGPGEKPDAEAFPPASHPPLPKDDPTLPL